MNRLIGALLVTGAIFSSCSTEVKVKKQPNVIYILADDMGYGDLSCYGQEKFSTPNIDRLAAEGIRFVNHYAGSTVCAPSRGSLMTGKHTGHSYNRGNKGSRLGDFPIAKDEVTVAEVFKDAGYVTGMFGKWGLGYVGSEGDPNEQGFDEFYGYLHQALAHNYYPYYLWHNSDTVFLEGNEGFGLGKYAPTLIHNEVMNFLEANKDTTFFLYYPSIIPHAELFVPDNYLDKHRGKYLPEKNYKGNDGGKGYKTGGYGSQKESHAAFAAMINLLDDQVGEIVDKVTELGIADNTIIIFSSDNGAHAEGGADPKFFNSTGGLRGIKRDLYEGGVRVPMIVKWPGVVEAGRQSEHISAFWDVLPTVADIVNVTAPDSIDGISFLPELLGQEQEEHDHLYWEFYEKEGRQAVRKGPWKAVRYKVAYDYDSTPVELYNLDKDPYEENNVAAQHPELAAELLALIKECHTPSDDFTFHVKKKNK